MGRSKAVLRPRNTGKASSESASSRSQPVLRPRSEGSEREPEDEVEEEEEEEDEGEEEQEAEEPEKTRRRRRRKRRGESEEGRPRKVRRRRRRKEKEDQVDADTTELLQKLIRGVYERCNPEKMSKLPRIFKKYRGLEAEVYRKACRKYGVAPEIDLSRFDLDAHKKPTQAQNGSRPQSGPKPGSGGSWPFLEDYEGNSSCSSDEAIVQQSRPPGWWQQPKPVWSPWSHQYVTPGSWVPPTGSPGAWVPPTEAPKPPPEAEKLDPDLKDLLYGGGAAKPPAPAPPNLPPPQLAPMLPGTSPFERMAAMPPIVPQRARAPELQLEDFLGEWHDTMGHKVTVEWACTNTSRGQLEVELSKKGKEPIRLNVKQLGPGRFSCGHYQLEVEQSSQYKIVWEDCKQKSKQSVWER